MLEFIITVKPLVRHDVSFHRLIDCLLNSSATLTANKASSSFLQYIPRNMHTVFALLCFVVVIHWLIFPYPSGLLHWHCGNLTIAPVPAKQPWWIWMNNSCELIMNDCIATTKQSTTKPCTYFLGYTVGGSRCRWLHIVRNTWKNKVFSHSNIPYYYGKWTYLLILISHTITESGRIFSF